MGIKGVIAQRTLYRSTLLKEHRINMIKMAR
jgi:hypothetical protein